jgi:hypothetical protein
MYVLYYVCPVALVAVIALVASHLLVSTGCLLDVYWRHARVYVRLLRGGFVYLSTTSITATYLSIDNATNC